MRPMHLLFACSFVALSMSSVACGGAADETTGTQDSTEADVTSAATVKLTTANDGKTVKVNAGQKVALTLSENASTGYMWMVSDDGGLADPAQTSTSGNVHTPGAPGTTTFTWSTTGTSGKHTLKLIYQRPWAETLPPAKTFTVTLDIAAKGPAAKMCGGFAGLQCGKGEYCSYATSASCGAGDQSGTCAALPQICPMVVMPVCACDGKTYNNSCEANRAGHSVASNGACAK